MAINFFDIERQAGKELKLSKEPPKIEEISSKEVYLLDDNNNRVSQICGWIDTETKWPCLRTAGEGTIHAGTGRCSSHGSDTGESQYLDRLVDSISAESELHHFFDQANKAKDDYYDVEKLARMIGAVLQEYVNKYQFSWSEKKIDRFLSMIESWRRIVEVQQKKEQTKLLAITISTIIRAILTIISNNTSGDTYSKIVNQISNIELPAEISDVEFEEIK